MDRRRHRERDGRRRDPPRTGQALQLEAIGLLARHRHQHLELHALAQVGAAKLGAIPQRLVEAVWFIAQIAERHGRDLRLLKR
jgi:hypothetical protein